MCFSDGYLNSKYHRDNKVQFVKDVFVRATVIGSVVWVLWCIFETVLQISSVVFSTTADITGIPLLSVFFLLQLPQHNFFFFDRYGKTFLNKQ